MNSYPFLCCDMQRSVLIWDFYGFWSKNTPKNEPSGYYHWVTNETRPAVYDLIENLKPADLQVEIKAYEGEIFSGKAWHADWIISDKNNPQIESHTGSVCGCETEQGAIWYAQNNFYKLKSLYDGDVEALLCQKETGIPCLPDWNTNESDSWGYKNGEQNKVLRANEAKLAKTMQQWKEDTRCLSDFLNVGNLLSTDMVDYFLCVLPPITWNKDFIQMGEPFDTDENGNFTYLTIKRNGVLWYYAGAIPKVK